MKSGVKYLKSLFKKNPEAAKKLINQNPAAKMPNTRPINRKTNKYDTKPGTHPADPENAATKKANDNLDWDPVTAKEKADWDKYATPDEKALAAELGNHAKRSPDQIKYKRAQDSQKVDKYKKTGDASHLAGLDMGQIYRAVDPDKFREVMRKLSPSRKPKK